MSAAATNPDRDAILAFLDAGALPRPIDSNPVAVGMHATLLAADTDVGAVTVRFEAGAHHIQGAGNVHGGVVATMLDLAIALAALARLPADQNPATVSLNVSMLRPVSPGMLTAIAQVDRAGRRIVHAAGRLLDSNGSLLATATAVMAIA